EKYDRTMYLPSGGIGGLDLLQSADALGHVKSVAFTTRKPASSLTKSTVNQEKTIFKGSARKAIKKFPENINVSIVLCLAGVGIDHTQVEIIADPTITVNIHKVEITGSFGTSTLEVTNHPLEANPKTSELAALSIIHTLK